MFIWRRGAWAWLLVWVGGLGPGYSRLLGIFWRLSPHLFWTLLRPWPGWDSVNCCAKIWECHGTPGIPRDDRPYKYSTYNRIEYKSTQDHGMNLTLPVQSTYLFEHIISRFCSHYVSTKRKKCIYTHRTHLILKMSRATNFNALYLHNCIFFSRKIDFW